MELNNLRAAKGAVRKRKRIARGQGSGHGGTATRGHKGAKSRSGYKTKRGFEGGQMPLQKRVPKRGFKNPNRVDYHVFNLDRISEIAEKWNVTEVSTAFLMEKGYVKRNGVVKILGGGDLNSGVSLKVDAVTASAKEQIAKSGGKIEIID